MENISFAESLLVAVLGMLMVFAVLILLMAIIKIPTIVVSKIENRG
ncbi:MAG: OadG family protein, partial [Oscillospiraceae bacterium]|nr:OadG family protein [Oscillospiraceae bacterium]